MLFPFFSSSFSSSFSLLQVVPEANPKRTILDAIHAVLTQKWFHGDIETADATYRIQNCPQVDTRRTARTVPHRTRA